MANPLLDAVTAVGRRLKQAYDATDAPGPEFHPDPFRPGSVTGEAVALKSIAALIAGRRAAANARVKREAADSAIAHRDALTQQIQARLATPPPPTYSVKLPSGTEVPLTAAQLAAHEARLKAQTETQGRFETGQKAIQGRFDAGMKAREGRGANAGKRYNAAQSALGNLDKEAMLEGDRAAQVMQAEVDRNILILQNPKATVTQKANAASALGLLPMPQTGGLRQRPAVYDLSSPESRGAIKAVIERAKNRAILRAQLSQGSRRKALQSVSLEESGIMQEDASTEDPLLQMLDELSQLYGDVEGSRDLQNIPDDEPIRD